MKFIKFFLFIWTTLLFISCSKENVEPESGFLIIYDDNNYNAVYKPVGLGQSDSSLFVLSERNIDVSNFSGINLVKSKLDGSFVSETILDDQYVAPTKGLVKIGANHFFFCMDRNTLRPYLVSISPDGNLNFTAINLSTSYPLAISKDNQNQLILLSYNQEDRQSAISIVSPSGEIVRQASYSIGAGNDVLESIINHFTRENGELPFFCGQAPNNLIYFNGFYNYTLSTVFTDFSDNPAGVIQGQSTDAAMKYLLPISGNNFAFVAYQFEDHFMSGFTELPSNSISSSVNYFNRKVPEIAYNSSAKIIHYQFNNDDVTIIAAETEGRQVVLYFYDSTNGDLLNSYFIGTLNPFTFSDICIFDDGGIGIVGTTFLADRFERIYLQKISRDQLINLF